ASDAARQELRPPMVRTGPLASSRPTAGSRMNRTDSPARAPDRARALRYSSNLEGIRMDRHPSRLRYVDAGQLESRVLNLDGLDVRNTRDEHIGDVEGLLIDSVSGRPRYLVVDSGGWFRSRTFLLPVAHARLDESRRALRADIDKDTINRFPQMRSDRYDALPDQELQQYDEGVWRA